MKNNVLMRILSPVLGQIKFSIFLAALGAICSVLAYVSFVFIVKNLLNGQIAIWLIILAGLLTFGEYLLRMGGFLVSHKAAFKLEEILRTQISTHLSQIPYGQIITQGVGKFKKIMLDNIKNLHSFVADTTPTFGRIFLTPILTSIAMIYFDFRLFLISFVVLIFGMYFMKLAFKDATKYRKDYEKNGEKINASIIEFIQAMPIVRTFSDGTNSFARYENALNDYSKALKDWVKISSFPSRMALILLSTATNLVILAIFGAIFMYNNSLEFSDFLGALLLGSGLFEAIMPLMFINNFIRTSYSSADEILSVLDSPKMKFSDFPLKLDNFNICFKNVNFSYDNSQNLALKNINLTINQGEICALVGQSGAGKSTLAMLLGRFFDPNSGEILIGGKNIKEIPQKQLFDAVSIVFQDNFLFNETILQNLAKAKDGASSDEIKRACVLAGVDEFIQNLPNGYDTIVGDRGTNLSGGERQRISIARAILKDAQIIVLDEATAFSDPQTEEKILSAISNLIKNKTLIIIAHRLLSVKNANKIVVFDNGEISGVGAHDELMQNCEIYKQLYNAQNELNLLNKGDENE